MQHSCDSGGANSGGAPAPVQFDTWRVVVGFFYAGGSRVGAIVFQLRFNAGVRAFMRIVSNGSQKNHFGVCGKAQKK